MTTPEEDRHRAARQEESRRRQAAVNVNRILADQREGERLYMTQRAAQQEADRLRAAQQSGTTSGPTASISNKFIIRHSDDPRSSRSSGSRFLW